MRRATPTENFMQAAASSLSFTRPPGTAFCLRTSLAGIGIAVLAACAAPPPPGVTPAAAPRLDNAQLRDDVVQTGRAEYRLTVFGAEVHRADQVERAFAARAARLCAAGKASHPPARAEPYQYDTGAGSATAAHSDFKATALVSCGAN